MHSSFPSFSALEGGFLRFLGSLRFLEGVMAAPQFTPQFQAAPPQPVQVTMETRFQDMPAQWQQQWGHFDLLVKRQAELCEEVSRRPTTGGEDVNRDARRLEQLLLEVRNTLERDGHAVESFKRETSKELRNAETAARQLGRLTGTLREPPLRQNLFLPSPYFWDMVSSFDQRMQLMREHIAQLDRVLSTQQSEPPTPHALQEILRYQRELTVSLAASVGLIQHKIEEEKGNFLRYRSRQFGDVGDPFEEADRAEERRAMLRVVPVPPIPRTGIFGPEPAPAATPAPIAPSFLTPQPQPQPQLQGFAVPLQPAQPGFSLGGQQSLFQTPASRPPLSVSIPTSTPAPLGAPAFGVQPTATAPTSFSFGQRSSTTSKGSRSRR
eukprot:TRINITY_DN7470_c0_g2_i1.p1 TRINITY_DN7470_c0_g2~~TRINITY_DN7470_c0_g2_i1.p1  ORF type:complete len:381 (-),score=62.51 TRINITY_DN7470_c0_g2_i1:41-1183(-)